MPTLRSPRSVENQGNSKTTKAYRIILQWKVEFRAKLLLKPGNSEKSKAKASAHIHHWGEKVEKKTEHAYIRKRKLLGLASFHRCRWEGFQKSNEMTSLHSGYPKTRSKNAQVVSRYQRDPQITKNRGKQFKTGEKQNRLESYLNPEKSGWVDPRIFFFLVLPFAILFSSPKKNPDSSCFAPPLSFLFLCVSIFPSKPPLPFLFIPSASMASQPPAWPLPCPCNQFPGRKGAPLISKKKCKEELEKTLSRGPPQKGLH